MKAREAQQLLGLTPHDFSQRLLDWIGELQLHTTRVLLLEEKLSPAALAARWHIEESTASRIIKAVNGRRKLSRKCLRAPASALEAFFVNKTLPKRKEKRA